MSSSFSSDQHHPRIVAGRYQIVRKIGSGGMGAVYLARQVNVGNQVAIKFLPAQLADDADLRRRFEREAALTLQVTHPGAAQLLDAGQDEDGRLYLVFEFVEGDDLSTLLDRDGALAYDEAFAVTLKVAEALAYAHHKGVVHRDIKPENIRVRRDLAGLHVKVLDFGIARVTDEAATRLTVEGSGVGTPRYMAPEQITGGTIDARTDVYALGLVLFEMLSRSEGLRWEVGFAADVGTAERTGAAVAQRAADARSPGARRDHRQGVREAAQRAIRLDGRHDQSAAGGSVAAMVGGATDGAATWQRCTWRVHVAGLSADSRPRPAGPNDACTRKVAMVGAAFAAIATIAVAVALWFAIGPGKDALRPRRRCRPGTHRRPLPSPMPHRPHRGRSQRLRRPRTRSRPRLPRRLSGREGAS